MVGILVLTLYRWMRGGAGGRHAARSSGLLGLATPDRIAAYEEIWRREESELWRWLEDRVGPGVEGATSGLRLKRDEKMMEERVTAEAMNERQIGDAIRVTRERLETLEEAVRGKKRREGEGWKR